MPREGHSRPRYETLGHARCGTNTLAAWREAEHSIKVSVHQTEFDTRRNGYFTLALAVQQ